MANAVYPLYKQNLLAGTSGFDLDQTGANGTYAALIDGAAYTYSAAHDFYNDAAAGEVGTPQEITTPTVVNGTFDGDNVTFTAVSGATVEIIILYRKNAGANTTWPVVLYLDTSVTGLPVTPNGGDITITWNASGIFTLSDRRFKENVEEVGVLGRLPVYSYTYLGSDHPHLGFMAQDVEKIVPDAVVDFGAFKAVDYGLAIACQ